MIKKGDTLIEVALAIGVFSMIAISIASVISSSTSGAQLSLETTLAREEIDAQAETIRFIHNAYASNKENDSQPLTQLWKKIIEKAVKLKTGTTETDKAYNESIVQYNPSTCDDLYKSGSPTYNHAFVINPRELDKGKDAYIAMNSGVLQPTTTYPRLIFGNYRDNDDNSELQNSDNKTNLYRAEGVYVVAVKDTGTNIVDSNGESKSNSAYYDFYIRTCWYGTGNDEPSTISTVIRLHDPDVVTVKDKANVDTDDEGATPPSNSYRIFYNSKGGTNMDPNPTSCTSFPCSVSSGTPLRTGYDFGGWCTVDSDDACSDGTKLGPGEEANDSLFNSEKVLNLYAIWTPQVRNSKTVSVSLTNSAHLKDLSLCIYGGECVEPPKCHYLIFGWYCEAPTITLDVFEDKNYYFYVKDEPNFWDELGGLDNLKGASVTVTDKTANETITFNINTVKSEGLYWNVFAYKNGQIVERQTLSNSPETNY